MWLVILAIRRVVAMGLATASLIAGTALAAPVPGTAIK